MVRGSLCVSVANTVVVIVVIPPLRLSNTQSHPIPGTHEHTQSDTDPTQTLVADLAGSGLPTIDGLWCVAGDSDCSAAWAGCCPAIIARVN